MNSNNKDEGSGVVMGDDGTPKRDPSVIASNELHPGPPALALRTQSKPKSDAPKGLLVPETSGFKPADRAGLVKSK